MANKQIVFTDLDGTLLDHDTYAFSPAQKALDHLKNNAIPLVINSSKTFDEIIEIRKTLDNSHPFIAENGSIVAVPKNYFPGGAPLTTQDDLIKGMQIIRLGGDRKKILTILNHIKKKTGFRFTGFEDMGEQMLSRATGLSLDQARLAKKRMSTEPIIWKDTQAAWAQFTLLMKKAGLQWVQGGRFISISRPYDKKDGVCYLMDLYKTAFSDHILFTIGLGDSPNDQGMLELMDVAVIINSDRSCDVRVSKPEKIIQTTLKGPVGWQEAMDQIFNLSNPIKGRA